VAGVALGVASVVSIQIINLNALSAFRGSMDAVSGNADLMVVGKMPTLPPESYPIVLSTPGVEAAWPMARVDVLVEGPADEPAVFLQVVGVDFFTPVDVPWEGAAVAVGTALETPGWVAVTPSFARERGWELGERVAVSVGTRKASLMIGAFSDFQRATPLASPRLAVMDIAQVQSLLGAPEVLHQIDVKLREGESADVVASALERALASRASVLTPEQREQQAAGLLSAFRLNLTALSLVSLFVGGFLVYSSTQANLVRRRTEFGLLRSLGATHRQVMGLLVADVGLLGLLGVGVGMPLGYLAARANVDRVSATVSNLYLLEEIHRLDVPLWFFVLGGAVGLFGACLGALVPALELGRKDTRSLLAAFPLHDRVSERAPALFAAGLAVLGAIVAIYFAFGDRFRFAGFVQAFLLIAAIPLLSPWLVRRLSGLLRVRSFGLAYGAKALGRQLQTTPIAVAALAIAVSMVVGVTVMVSSFRQTLEIWIDQTVRADIYVSTPSGRRGGVFAEDVLASLKAYPAVTHVDRMRQFFASSGSRRFSLAAVDAETPSGRERFALVEGDSTRLPPDEVFVGETLARKLGVHVGEVLPIEGPDGVVELPIAAVYYDYSGELGSAFVSLETMERHFGPGPVSSVALYLAESSDAESIVDELRYRFREVPIVFRSNRGLRERAMEVFDQTFAVTRLLRYMSLLIAVCGVTLTLFVLARERVAELALYRALGASRAQIFRMYLGKGLGMGTTGVVLGTAAGIAFALVLIFVVNRAFFGWTISVYWPTGLVLSQNAAVLVASTLASVYPAVIASRIPATELRREDL